MTPFKLFKKRHRRDKALQLEQKKSQRTNINRVGPNRYYEEEDTYLFI